jgi:hypothetical protein
MKDMALDMQKEALYLRDRGTRDSDKAYISAWGFFATVR